MQLPIKVKAHVTVHPGFMCMYLAMDTADELEELEWPVRCSQQLANY